MAATVATFAYDALDDAAISVFVPVTYARFILHREGESLLVLGEVGAEWFEGVNAEGQM
jgi:hypothetical protein